MTDYASFATSRGTVFIANVDPTTCRIHGMGSCSLGVAADHIERIAGSVAVMPDEAAKFSHGTPFRLIDGAVVADTLTLAEVQRSQTAAVRKACAAAITGGFSSSALGATYHYPSNPTDQANLTAAATRALLQDDMTFGTFSTWCQDSSGNWAMAAHTAAQTRQVAIDCQAAISAARLRLGTLVDAIAAATTTDGAAAISW